MMNTLNCSFRRRYDPTPAEKKFMKSLHGNYDPFKDVKLNDKRPSTSLPPLTQKVLQEHQERLKTKKQKSNVVPQASVYEKQNPVPPIILDQLKKAEHKKWTKDPRYAPFTK